MLKDYLNYPTNYRCFLRSENRTNQKKEEMRRATNQLDLRTANLYLLDVQYYVNRKDGTFVPAEVAVMPLTQTNGARACLAAESFIISADKR